MMDNEKNEEVNPLFLPAEKKELKKLVEKIHLSHATLNAKKKQIVDGKGRAASASQQVTAVELTQA